MPPLLTKREKDRLVTYAGWGKVDHDRDGWCKRFPKTCKALKRCLVASAAAYAGAYDRAGADGRRRERDQP